MNDLNGNFDPPDGGLPVRERPVYEPMFNAPWPSVVLLAALGVAFAAQMYVLPDAVIDGLVLSPASLRAGGWIGLVGYMFLHSGWAHFLMNAASALAFGPPVARYLGARGRGALLFFGFFLVCGVLAGLGFCAVRWGSPDVAVGASGAISGLWGAASRLLADQERLAPIWDRQVLLQGAAFAVVNVVVGQVGLLGAMHIAWEAHLFGYIAGLLLIGLFGRLRARAFTA
jgi:membrane associated rhomboid family serine protease